MSDEVEQIDIQLNSIRQQLKKKKKAEEDSFLEQVDVSIMSQNIKELQAELKSKANINDVCALVDSKASSNTVFQVLDEMKKSITFLNGKQESDNATTRHFEQFIKQQKYINERLCPLNCRA